MALRLYQRSAIDALFDYWESGEEGNPLIDLATGAGKSMVMAEIIIKLVKEFPGLRVGVITHVKELIEQNFEELIGLWPEAPAGIFSAGLKRRDHRAQILFGGIQTIWNKTGELGAFDIVFIDECHLIPRDASTSYGQFFKAALLQNPDMRIVGLTATPYRLDSGRLDEGDDKMFDRVIYTYSIADGVRDGYLTPLSTKATSIEISTKGVGKLAGDFKKGALAKAADEITEQAVREIVQRGGDRRSWLAFCSGVDHAISVRDEIRAYGIDCETVHSDTPAGERRDILNAFKNYELRCVTNNAVLTTGFNHKGVDLIAALRPTLSVSLYLQMMGRGTRVLYAPGMSQETAEDRRAAIAAGRKPSCLILDFAKLVDTHGPVDMVTVAEPGSGDGEAPSKTCPTDPEKADKNKLIGCGEKVHTSVRICKCGYEFEFDTAPKITASAADVAIISTAEPEWHPVQYRRFSMNAKEGKIASVKVAYINGKSQKYDWLCPGHGGNMTKLSNQFWVKHKGELPPPATALEFIERQNELCGVSQIFVKPGKNGYWKFLDYEIIEQKLFRRSAKPPVGRPVMNDEIPF